MYEYICHKCLLIFCSEKAKENKCPNCTSVNNFQDKQKSNLFSCFHFNFKSSYADYINFTKKYL